MGKKVTKADLKAISYWLPEFQPEHIKAKVCAAFLRLLSFIWFIFYPISPAD